MRPRRRALGRFRIASPPFSSPIWPEQPSGQVPYALPQTFCWVHLKRTKRSRNIPFFTIAKMAEELGIEGDKALQLLLECERQQALRKKGGR